MTTYQNYNSVIAREPLHLSTLHTSLITWWVPIDNADSQPNPNEHNYTDNNREIWPRKNSTNAHAHARVWMHQLHKDHK